MGGATDADVDTAAVTSVVVAVEAGVDTATVIAVDVVDFIVVSIASSKTIPLWNYNKIYHTAYCILTIRDTTTKTSNALMRIPYPNTNI